MGRSPSRLIMPNPVRTYLSKMVKYGTGGRIEISTNLNAIIVSNSVSVYIIRFCRSSAGMSPVLTVINDTGPTMATTFHTAKRTNHWAFEQSISLESTFEPCRGSISHTSSQSQIHGSKAGSGS